MCGYVLVLAEHISGAVHSRHQHVQIQTRLFVIVLPLQTRIQQSFSRGDVCALFLVWI